MFSLQRLLGQEDRFFKLLEASAQEARESARLLIDLLNAKPGQRGLEEFSQVRRKDKRITQELTELLCKTFVTPLEREEIEALSHALYKIPKTAEKFGERLLLCPERLHGIDFSKQTAMLVRATDTLLEMVRELGSGKHLERVKEQNDQLQKIEGEADNLILEMLQHLYRTEQDPVTILLCKDLLELLEKVIDRCRNAGNVIFQIVLKHS
ncbi:MAG: DUF47 family protein [Chthoniobacterales bacterium]|nr:DUF47 family protein [Chthoniobacterales bacterium]